jgi:hypothetical protein
MSACCCRPPVGGQAAQKIEAANGAQDRSICRHVLLALVAHDKGMTPMLRAVINPHAASDGSAGMTPIRQSF